MLIERPKGLLAGFYAARPDPAISELVHIGEQWVPPSWRIPRHSHTHWEFYLQTSGTTRWKIDGKLYDFTPGSFCAIAPGVPHELCARPPIKHHFFFAALDLPEILRHHQNLSPTWCNQRVIYFNGGNNLEMPFRQLIGEVSEHSLYRSTGLRLSLDYLLVSISRLAGKVTACASFTGMHPAVLRAKAHLETKYNEPCRLTDLAQIAGLSPTHFSELFTRQVGLPPHQYLLRVRITRARELLRNSDIAITELALELGFNSSQHFALWFKRMTGNPASVYRRTSAPAPARSAG